jgi:hypothetical protein
VVGEGEGREVECPSLLDELVQLGGPVEEAVLGMHMEVDELGVPHALYSHSMVLGGFEETS